MRSGGWNRSFESAKPAARSLIFGGKQRFKMTVTTNRRGNRMCCSGPGCGTVRRVLLPPTSPVLWLLFRSLRQTFPVQPDDFCISLASHSSSHEKPYEYLLKTWETSAVGFLHREMNYSFSSAVYHQQTSIPSLGGPYRSPPSFHSPSANPLFCSFQCKSCYSLQIISPLMTHWPL